MDSEQREEVNRLLTEQHLSAGFATASWPSTVLQNRLQANQTEHSPARDLGPAGGLSYLLLHHLAIMLQALIFLFGPIRVIVRQESGRKKHLCFTHEIRHLDIDQWLNSEDSSFIKNRNGENLGEYSHALMTLSEEMQCCEDNGIICGDQVLHDQFSENVIDVSLRRELKRIVRQDRSVFFIELSVG